MKRQAINKTYNCQWGPFFTNSVEYTNIFRKINITNCMKKKDANKLILIIEPGKERYLIGQLKELPTVLSQFSNVIIHSVPLLSFQFPI